MITLQETFYTSAFFYIRQYFQNKMPFYAVKLGRVTGVYTSWPDCQKQVKGFKGAKYKKFDSRDDAEEFVKSRPPIGAHQNCSTTATAAEGVPVYKLGTRTVCPVNEPPSSVSVVVNTQSEQCQLTNLVSSIKNQLISLLHLANTLGAKSENANDEPAMMRNIQMKRYVENMQSNLVLLENCLASCSSSTNTLGTNGFSSEGPSNSTGQDNRSAVVSLPCQTHKNAQQATKYKPACADRNKGLNVYTDGACTNNGRGNPQAGIGVYWGQGSKYNVSERLTGRQTNNRAEIHAACKALEQVQYEMHENKVTVNTDSEFLIKSVTQWMPKWKENDWKLSTGGNVKNRADFEKLDELSAGMDVTYNYVPGHSGIEGNERADRLAVEGSKRLYIKRRGDYDSDDY